MQFCKDSSVVQEDIFQVKIKTVRVKKQGEKKKVLYSFLFFFFFNSMKYDLW